MPEPDRVLDGVLTIEEVGLEGLGLEAVTAESVAAGVGEETGGVGGGEGVAEAVGVDTVGADEEGVVVEVCAERRATEEQESTIAAKAKKRRERKEIGSMKIREHEMRKVEPMKYIRRFRSSDCSNNVSMDLDKTKSTAPGKT